MQSTPAHAELLTVEDYSATPDGGKEFWLVDPLLRQIHLYDFARDTAKAVRLVEDNETFESALLPGLVVSAIEMFKR